MRKALIGKMSFVGHRPDVPGIRIRMWGENRDVLKLRPGITGPATLKYRLEDEMISALIEAAKGFRARDEGRRRGANLKPAEDNLSFRRYGSC